MSEHMKGPKLMNSMSTRLHQLMLRPGFQSREDQELIFAAVTEMERLYRSATIPTCCVTGAIPGDGGACGDCDPCIMGEPLVPEVVKRLIAEKNSVIQRNGELEQANADLLESMQGALGNEQRLQPENNDNG